MKKLLLFGALFFGSTSILSNTPTPQQFFNMFKNLSEEDQKKVNDINTMREEITNQLIQLEVKNQGINDEKLNNIKKKLEKDPEGASLTSEEKAIALIINIEELQHLLLITKSEFAELMKRRITEKPEEEIHKKVNDITKKSSEKKQLTIEEVEFFLVWQLIIKEHEIRELLTNQKSTNTPSQKKPNPNPWIHQSLKNQNLGANKK